MFGLQYFSFQALFSPYFLCFMVALCVVYAGIIGPYRHRFAGSEPVLLYKQFLFYTGMFLFYLAQGGPFELLGHMMFSFHMVSMAIAYVIVPPMILIGIPDWAWRSFINRFKVRQLRFLMHPILTAMLFNVLFSFYHVPQAHDVIMTNYPLHTAYYIVLLITSFMMWWHITCPVPEYNQLSELQKMGYIFLNGLLLTPACALIIFAGAPLYAVYSDPKVWAEAMGYCVPGDPSILLQQFKGPAFFNIMSATDDQQLGGVIMKLLQETVYASMLLYVFRQWYKRENVEDAPNEMTPRDHSAFMNPADGLIK